MPPTQDTSYGLADYLSLVRRRARYIAVIFPSCLLVSIFLAYWLPSTYRSSVTLLLEKSSIPQDLVKQTVVTGYVDDEINLVRNRVLASDKLAEIIKTVDPYPEMVGATLAEKVQRLADDTELEKVDPVTMKTMDDSNAFSIHYQNPDPHRAVVIARQLADLFVTYNTKTRSETAEATYRFLQAQSADLAAQIRDTDMKLAKFKDKYGTALPGEESHNEIELDRTRRDLDNIEQKIRDERQRQISLRSQLSQMSPSLLGLATDGRSQLAVLKAQLADAMQRYTPEHPDVKRLKAQIAILTATGTPGAGVAPDNPAYIEAQTELSGVTSELAALEAQAKRTRAEVSDYESRLQNAPSVEREYVDLTRTHETAQQRYTEIQTKLGQAELAQKLEDQQRGQHFVLVRPASIPKTTHYPNRMGLLLLGTVLGLGLAFGGAALADSSDPTVRSPRDLRTLTNLPNIAAIPTLRNVVDQRHRALRLTVAASVLGLAIVFVGMTVFTAKHRESQLLVAARTTH